MLKNLKSLKMHSQAVATARKVLTVAAENYDYQIDMIEHILGEVKRKRGEDPDVLQATEDLYTLESKYVDVVAQTKQAIVDYWEEFGFSTGKKSVNMEGCRLGIRETTSRQIVNPSVVVQAAIDDGVCDKVVRELRPVFNKAAFNAWVDLKAPPGVEVTNATTATVKILEEE